MRNPPNFSSTNRIYFNSGTVTVGGDFIAPSAECNGSTIITIDVSNAPATIGLIGGWQISSAAHVAINTWRMTDLNTISVRVVNNYTSTTSADAKIRVIYI